MQANTLQNLVALLCTTTVLACGGISPQKRVGSTGDTADIIGSGSNRGDSSAAGASTAGATTAGASTAGGSTAGSTTAGEEELIATTGRVTAVTLNGNSNRSVKQGFGTVTLRATGTQLDEVNSVLVKRGKETLPCKLINAAATSLECELEVPHGLLGDLALHLDEGSTADFARAVTVTSLWVKPSDTTAEDAMKSPTKPFATLKYALSFAQEGDTIELAEGDYDIPVDEAPTRGTRADSPCVQNPTLNGVSIDGHGSVLTGSKYASNFVVGGTSALSNLSLKSNSESSHGIITLGGANLTLTNVSLSGGQVAEQYAAYLCGKSTLTHTGKGTVSGWATAYVAEEQASLQVINQVHITENGAAVVGSGAQIVMEQVSVDGNNVSIGTTRGGVFVNSGSEATLRGVTFSNNGVEGDEEYGSLYTYSGSVTLDGCTFDHSKGGGHVISIAGASSLKITGEPTNVINRSAVYGIRDTRNADSGETIASVLRFAGTQAGTSVDGYADDKDGQRWFILNSGNMLVMK